MVHAGDRPAAIDRLRRALDETEIGGIQTTLPFDRFVVREPSFLAGDLSTGWVPEHWDGPAERAGAVRRALLAGGLAAISDGAAGPIGAAALRASPPAAPGRSPMGRAAASPGGTLADGRPERDDRPVAGMSDERPEPTAAGPGGGRLPRPSRRRTIDPRAVRVSWPPRTGSRATRR